jgi:hypothetical protein
MASTYLNRNASATATTFTYSVWLKRSGLASDFQYFFSYQSSGGGSNGYGLAFNGSTNKMYYYGTGGTATTDRVFRDPAAWYHVVLSVTSGTGTLYVNNETVKSSISVNQVTSGEGMTIGAYKYGSTIDYQFDGYMAHAHFTDGYAYTPSTFGSTATNGQWVPNLAPSVTYGTNGFFLKFTNASDLGEDFSGNNNDFTKSGSGDQVNDNPENVFATLNPNDNYWANSTFSEGNCKMVTAASGYGYPRSTIGLSTGKWYFEAKASDLSGNLFVGIVSTANNGTEQEVGYHANDYGYKFTSGAIRTAGSETSYGNSISTSDILGVAIDLDNNKLYFSKNGTFQNSADPVSGSNGFSITAPGSTIVGEYFPTASDINSNNSSTLQLNFGNPSFTIASGNADGNGEGNFEYAPPTGYLAICTNNVSSELTIPVGKGDSYFKIKPYTGNGTSQTITGVGFQPDFIWLKNRQQSDWHNLVNSTVGATKRNATNSTVAENTNAQNVSAFASDGFSVGNDSNTNANGENYISWNWLSNGGTTASNSDGSITSTVQANTTSGFSIVTYTGTQANATVGHGLGVPPKMIIVKCRTSDNNWPVYHASITADNYLRINTSNALDGAGIFWNDTEPTNTVFSIGASDESNKSGGSQLAYCFAEKKGFSKMGKFSGNSNLDGPFIYTGFSTKWVMYKNITSATDWMIFDEERIENVGASRYYYLEPNTSDNEGNSRIEFLSNGFKLRENAESGAKFNETGQTYIYMAFAENPFVDSSGVPTTAR